MTILEIKDIKERLLKKLQYSLNKVHYIEPSIKNKENYEKIVAAAIHVASTEFSNSEDIYREAKKLINAWIREEGLGDAQRDYQRQVYRPPEKIAVDDVFTLPWGQRIDESVISSGIANAAIDPKTADAELLEEDTAKELFKLLDWIYAYWGPQALGWIVLLNTEHSTADYKSKEGTTIKDVMRQIGIDPNSFSTKRENTAMQRIITKILNSVPKENNK